MKTKTKGSLKTEIKKYKTLKNELKMNEMLKEATKTDEILYDDEEYMNAIINGDILLPVYDQGKMIAKVQWNGNLGTISYDDKISQGAGLLKIDDNIILTLTYSSGKAKAKLVSEYAAIYWIIYFEQYHLFDKLDLHDTLQSLVGN